MSRRWGIVSLLVASALWGACAAAGTGDAGTADVGPADAAARDQGVVDSGRVDSGVVDAVVADSGAVDEPGGVSEAGAQHDPSSKANACWSVSDGFMAITAPGDGPGAST